MRGVQEGRLSLHKFVELTSHAPARLYGLQGRKGSILIGADADIVMWDLASRIRIDNAMLHHAVDYTPYEGIEVPWPVHCLSRGELLVENRRYLEPPPGRGLFLPAGLPVLR
jgi:dihydropyrimidinase